MNRLLEPTVVLNPNGVRFLLVAYTDHWWESGSVECAELVDTNLHVVWIPVASFRESFTVEDPDGPSLDDVKEQS